MLKDKVEQIKQINKRPKKVTIAQDTTIVPIQDQDTNLTNIFEICLNRKPDACKYD